MTIKSRASDFLRRWDVSISDKTIPLAFLVILFVAFGLFITQLGFYQDDWHHIYFAHSLGLNRLWEMFLYDGRPAAATLYIAGFSILGFSPLHWQISTLLLRFLTVLFTWLSFQAIWPEHKREVTWAALLFAIYPLFKVQELSVAYAVHWTGYLLFSISIWGMVQSLRKPRWFWLYLALALVTQAAGLAFIEYFSGVELIRPFIIWLVLSEEKASTKQRLLKTLKLWLPYLLVFVAFLVYRIYLIPSPQPGYERNIPTILFDLFKTPLSTSIQLVQNILQDTFYILVSVWSNVLTADYFNITVPFNIKVILIGTGLGLALYFYLRRLKYQKAEDAGTDSRWYKSAFWIGLALTVLGPIPAWLTGQSVSQDNPLWSGRLGMASMIGASLVIVAVLEFLIREKKIRLFILVTIIALTVSWHIITANGYRQSWAKQTEFYHQLKLRAPLIEPNTALLSDEEIFPYMGEYPTAFALGNLYPKLDSKIDVNYWFYSILRRFNDQIPDLISGMQFKYENNFGRFYGDSRDSLVLYYMPENKQCLWVLTPEDSSIRELPSVLRQVAQISNLSRIKTGTPEDQAIFAEIFGKDPKPDWCYFYEKAGLAQQNEDWKQVVSLWNTAKKEGFRPQSGVEFIPFIQGFAYQGDWAQAGELTLQANKLAQGMKHTLCPMWDQLVAGTSPSQERDAAMQLVQVKINCGG
jgi:hypothetical protein